MNAEQELRNDIGRFCRDPLGFAWYVWPWAVVGSSLEESDGPRMWQQDILNTIGLHLRSPNRFTPLNLAVSSGHGIGKSALIAMICNWAMSTCEDCRVVMTANTEAQLRTKTWPEVSKWTKLAINSHWWTVGATTVQVKEKDHERVWRVDAIPWSETNTEAFAGLHNRGKRIVVLFDEGSAISDAIWEVTEGALTDADTEIIWVVFGNPTRNTGRFRECFGRYKHRWVTRQIDSRKVDGTNKEQLDKWVADYGEDSDFCRVRVRGEFPRAGSTQFISGEVVAQARKRSVQGSGWKILSVDVARFGDDQTVIGCRHGQKAVILEKIRGLDTVQVARRVIFHMQQEIPRVTVIDGDGIGGGVIDYVNEYAKAWLRQHSPARVQEFHGGMAPGDTFMYFNWRAEAWGLMRKWLEEGDIPDDPELASDLTGPEYFFSSKNQIQLERKEDMKKRGLASPDIGDMLAMTFGITPAGETHDERVLAQIEAADPVEQHFIRLRETARREGQRGDKGYWE
jgi:hypothetical protein